MKKLWVKFANEYVVSLFPVFMLPTGLWQGSKKLLGTTCAMAFKIQGGNITWYFKPNNWQAAHLALVKKIKQDPKFLRYIYEQMASLGEKQIIFSKKLAKAATKASNSGLWKIYSDYIKSNTEVYEYGLMLPLLDYQDTTFLSDELNRILKQKKQLKHENLLTIPLKETAGKQQEIKLLELYKSFAKNKSVVKLFKLESSDVILGQIKKQQSRLYQKLIRHTQDFAWAYYVYEGPAATASYFVDLLKDLVAKKINPEVELKKHFQEKIKLKAKQNKILNSMGLSAYEKQLVILARDGVFYKAYRRELQSCSYYYMESVLRKIGSRLGISLSQVRMMLPQEIKQALLNKRLNIETINQRSKALFYGYEKGKMTMLAGRQAENFINKNCYEEKINVKTNFVTGTTAYPGRVKGIVKIINSPAEMGKMQAKNILVATTTNPNLMPAIRQAAAVVTEEGGLTCHAAIVSRELKIPCVVGTKIATHVFKDGDKIFVDAAKGLVKKL